MAVNVKDEQWLQKATMNKVPIPDKTIGCQALVKKDVSHKGWLKRKKPLKVTTALANLFSSFVWDRKYVVLSKGCMYFYNSASDKKPEKAISLFGYTTIMRAGEFRAGRDGSLWPFKLAYVLDKKDKVHYFSADSEDEMKMWLRRIKRELYRANGFELTDDDVEQEDFSDLETPISTENYFHRFTDLSKIKETANADDSDADSDYEKYDYIDNPVPCPAPVSPRGPAKPAAKLPPLRSEKPANSIEQSREEVARALNKVDSKHAQPPSIGKAGYYPANLNIEPTPSSTATKHKAVPPTPPKGLGKIPPATPSKPKPQFSSQNSNENSNSSQISTSRLNLWERSSPTVEASFNSVANKFGENSKSRLNGYPTPKPAAKAALSTNSNMVKPLPTIPLSPRISTGPTAIVPPIRQSVPTENPRVPPGSSGVSRYDGDLETAAMWTRSAGEGQRLLVDLGQEGGYMIRLSSDEMKSYTLLVIADYQIRKYKIFTKENGSYSLLTDFKPSFDSLHDLLNHYRSNYLPKRYTMLSRPYSEIQRRR